MKDKVLLRRLFREKALKKYGGDMLPKYNVGDLVKGEGEKQGLASLFQPYDSQRAMLLAVSGRLLQAEQRPGEGMFSGVGRGVGKAISEDFPTISALKLEDRAARLK